MKLGIFMVVHTNSPQGFRVTVEPQEEDGTYWCLNHANYLMVGEYVFDPTLHADWLCREGMKEVAKLQEAAVKASMVAEMAINEARSKYLGISYQPQHTPETEPYAEDIVFEEVDDEIPF